MRAEVPFCVLLALPMACAREQGIEPKTDITAVDAGRIRGAPDREGPSTESARVDLEASLEWLRTLCPSRYRDWTADDLRSQAELDLSGFEAVDRLSSNAPVRVHRAIRDDDIRFLLPLVRLRALDLDRAEIRGGGIRALRSLPELRSLSLNASSITDAGIAGLSQITQLVELGLGNCRHLTGEGLQPLGSLTRLERLELFEDPLEAGWAQFLAALQGMRELSLSKTAMNALDLEVISRLPELRVLDIRGSPLTDREFESMANAGRLEELWLEGTGLTPAILPVLRQLDQLKLLGLPRSSDWPSADDLRDSFGSVKIYGRR